MPENSGTIEQLAGGILKALEPLKDELSGDNLFPFLSSLGLSFPSTLKNQPNFMSVVSQITSQIADLTQIIEDLKNAIETENTTQIASITKKSLETIRGLVNTFQTFGTELNNIATSFPGEIDSVEIQNFASQIPEKIIQYLLVTYLEDYFPMWLHFLYLVGVVKIENVQGNEALIGKSSFISKKIEFSNIEPLLKDPIQHFGNIYKWDKPDFDGVDILRQLHFISQTFALPTIADLEASLPSLEFYIATIRPKIDTSTKGLELEINPNIPSDFNVEEPFISDTTNLKLDFKAGLPQTTKILLFPKGQIQIIPPSGDITGEVNLSIVKKPNLPNGKILIFGEMDGSRFTSQGISGGMGFGVRTNGTQSEGDYRFFFKLDKGEVVLALGGSDGFISNIAPSELRMNTDLLIGYSGKNGFYFEGSAGIEIMLPTHINLGPIEIQALTIGIKVIPQLTLEAGANIKGAFGPLTVIVENIGLKSLVSFPSQNKGNLGPVNLDFSFKPPKGVGLSIDAAVVKGGGYLFFDFEREEYAGVLQISISGIVTITAIGMITTKMPDGSKGFSLLVIMSVEFMPGIQLGFGFTIAGIGGLIGLNRTMRLDALVQGVRTGTINNIMFPQGDIIANAPRIISDLRAIFPPEEGKFLIGPMIKLGWGTPTLISVSLGVIIEIPGNIAIIGVLRVILPDKEAPILVLQIAFVGAIEFDKKRLWFFAAMFESRILFMTIEGEMGLLVGWGDDANFVISVGGFNPRFNPPPLPFPTPRRIAIDMTISPVQRIRIEGYFAVTSNTVQFGARAEMVLGLDDFGIQGHIQFDALFQFSPFHFVIDISASFSLKAFGIGVFSIRLEFQLEGPTPWRAKGRGSISLFFFDISADFDITWGDSQDTTLPPIKVIEDLVKEINKVENWKAELPAANNLFVALRKLDEKIETLILHPLGYLRISQRLIPLDIKIDKVGNQKPEDANKFELKVTTNELKQKDFSLEPFALAQFQNMDDATKLTRPAFEKQHSGLELTASGNALKASRVVSRIIRYEEIIIDNNYKRFATKFKSFMGLLFRHFLNGNAVTKLSVSQSYKSKVNPFDDKIVVGSDKYSVAYNDTNKAFNGGKVYFDSHALAEEYMRTEISKQPNLVEALHVIPKFEAVGV